MVARHATPDADTTITHHLPPPGGDDSAQDVSMSFVIPPQADASNLLDQNYDDFFSGPGFVTLSTPALPRHLTNTRQSVRKVAGAIQTPATLARPILGQTSPTHSTTELELPGDRSGSEDTHIPSHPSPPIKPSAFTGPPTTASVSGTISITDPGSPRPNDTLSESDPDAKIYDGLKPNTASSITSIITTKASGTPTGIQSMSTSAQSRHSRHAQISRQPPVPAPQKKDKGLTQTHGDISAKSNQATSKPRSGIVLNREQIAPTQSRVRGGAGKRLKPTLSNRGVGRVKGRIESDPASSNSRTNVASHARPTGNEHSDPNSLGDPAESDGAVMRSLVTTVLPPSESIQSRSSLASGVSDPSPSLDPPRTAEDRVGTETTQDAAEERKDDDRLTVSRLSPSKTVWECRDSSENLDWNGNGIRPGSAPTPGTPLAVSPMRPSRKRAASAGQESDTEPGGAWPDELEKRCSITELNPEDEVKGGREGKEVQQADGENPRTLPQPWRKKDGAAPSSLILTRRLKAKAVRESPQVRKLRDKLAGRVVARGGAGRRPGIGGATKASRGRHAALDACGFPENAGASATSIGMLEGKGSDLALSGETTGPTMPYNGDNRQQQQEGGAISRDAGIAVGAPSFRSILKRSTVPVEFRFELAARMGTSRSSAVKENTGRSASMKNNREDGQKAAGSSRKRPKLGELEGDKSGVEETWSSRLSKAKDDHHDQTGSHAGAWKRSVCSRSNISSATSMGRSKRTPLIVPEAFRFSTEQRARDRGKFDEAVRAKQKEKERELEEDRAAKAIEEERGMKEMRKRAVPKANAVPEWYATMPKRKAA